MDEIREALPAAFDGAWLAAPRTVRQRIVGDVGEQDAEQRLTDSQ
jgi:hypothetical protein